MTAEHDTSVSFIVPAFNGGRYITAALDCVLKQTRPAAEIIVVDDGSTDDTAERVASYGRRIHYVKQANAGVSAARNTALALANGDYVALLDVDDLCSSDRIEKQVAALESFPSAVACFSGHYVFDDVHRVDYPGEPAGEARSASEWLCRLLVHPVTMVFRRAAAEGLTFPVGVRTGEDMIFAAQLRTRGPVIILPEVLYGYRRHAEQATERCTEFESIETRLQWALAWGGGVDPALAYSRVEPEMWSAAADALAGHYWARRERPFKTLQQQLRRLWPEHIPPRPELHWPWYPAWLWSCKSWWDSWRARPRVA